MVRSPRAQKNEEILDDRPYIVIVEDDEFLAGMYVAKLTAEDFKVELATTGEKGLELIHQTPPDLILLDIILLGSKLDGLAVLQALKENKKTAATPVIILTNLDGREYVTKALKLGAADYLIKSHFIPSEVVEKIRRILRS